MRARMGRQPIGEIEQSPRRARHRAVCDVTAPLAAIRTQATTFVAWTSNLAQRACSNSITASLVSGAGVESPECEIYNVRSPLKGGVAIRGARGTPGQTVTGSGHQFRTDLSADAVATTVRPFHGHVGPSQRRVDICYRNEILTPSWFSE